MRKLQSKGTFAPATHRNGAEIDWNSITDVQKHVTEWADKNFPRRTTQGVFIKAMEELGELAASPRSPHEFADMLILLVDYASLNGIDIPKAIQEKMEINAKRKWHFDDDTGLAHHVGGKNDRD